jgi:putative ABC transport system ATP-binding protein
MTQTSPVYSIEIEDLTKEFTIGPTTVRALRGVTARIVDGSFQFVLGPSGSGKSTLLYLLGALDRPSGGSITIDGRLINELSREEQDEFRRTEVGFVFQSFNLLGNLTALDNVLAPFLPIGVSGELRQRAEDLLVHVGLGDRQRHRPAELSGGEQQRVAIARALLKRPKLVLADEPTGELDHRTGAEVMGYLRDLREELGTTVVVVTHDESYIEPGDATLRLRDGQVVSD